MVKHCPTCHRTSKEARFYGEFCEFCMRDKLEKKLKPALEVPWCKRCERVDTGGRQFKDEDEVSVEAALQNDLKGYKVRLIKYDDHKSARVEVTETLHGEELSLEKDFELKFKNTICDKDYRIAAGYYEAVLQLRGSAQRAKTFIGRITRYFERNDQFISRIMVVDGGYDVYLSDKKLAAHFIEMQGLKPTTSYTLYGVKSGKKVYRNTYAIRFE